MSSKVSRLTLNGMFLMTMAVGMISSSDPPLMGGEDMFVGTWRWCKGGDPPEDRSELEGGDMERPSLSTWLSINC